MDDKLNNILKDLEYSLPKLSAGIDNANIALSEAKRNMQGRYIAEEKRKDDVLQTLKNIEANTIGLNDIIPLISDNIEKQDEVLEFLKEALAISASETREEAESKWRKLLNKATQLTTDVETIQKLTSFTSTVLNVYMENR